MSTPIVTKDDIKNALVSVGLKAGDICIFHSSYKSFGTVEGGAQTVIDAFEEVLGKEGTLVAPTLIQTGFEYAYETWYMDKPSDVGYLTEYFRKLMYVYRSNQPTHSVAARGKLAFELTYEHSLRGPHTTPFGDYAFSDGSPWQKMYDLDAKIVFIGVDMTRNTMKHLVESRFSEWALSQIKDEEKLARMKAQVKRYDYGAGVWPYYQGFLMQNRLDEAGLLRSTTCGNATILCVNAKESCDYTMMKLQTEPERYLKPDAVEWVRECLSE